MQFVLMIVRIKKQEKTPLCPLPDHLVWAKREVLFFRDIGAVFSSEAIFGEICGTQRKNYECLICSSKEILLLI